MRRSCGDMAFTFVGLPWRVGGCRCLEPFPAWKGFQPPDPPRETLNGPVSQFPVSPVFQQFPNTSFFRSICLVRLRQADPAIGVRHVLGKVFAIKRLNASLALPPLAQMQQ